MTYLIIYINNKPTMNLNLIFFNYHKSVEKESNKILLKILNIFIK